MYMKNIFKKQNKIKFLAIGDTVVDVFIRLKTAEVEKTEHGKRICMPFSEKIAFESATELLGVGNSANAAVSAARLGLSSALMTNLGNDNYGVRSKEVLSHDKVITDFIKINENKKTNYHYVLWYGDERTILVNHEKYDYILPSKKELENKLETENYIYLSSLAENTLDFHLALAEYLKENNNTKLVFQPGTFQMKFGTKTLADIYNKTAIFFCNKEEAMHILETENESIPFLLSDIKKLGVELPVITDGPQGAYTYKDESFSTVIHLPIYPDPLPPLERTGAGDAFASTFSVAKSLGLDNSVALMWGSINSMSVCQHIGAQEGLLTRNALEDFLKNKPADWNVTEIH